MLIYPEDEYGVNGLENLGNAVRELNITLHQTQVRIGTTDFSNTVCNLSIIVNIYIFLRLLTLAADCNHETCY